MRIKAHFLYILIAIYIVILSAYFLFGDTGIFVINKKIHELQQIEGRVYSLRAEINQMESDIERFKTDGEYIISSAKSYGYLEGKNEKVVRILNNNFSSFDDKTRNATTDKPIFAKNYDAKAHDNTTLQSRRTDKSFGGILPILFITIGSILIYIVVKYQINTKKRARA